MQIFQRFAVASVVLILGACSSIVEGTDQTVTVITDPPGANCTLTRDGVMVAVANPTPTSIVLSKSKDDVSVICKKDGHFDGASVVASSLEGMTFGNILFGGIIGVGIDAASGAMNKYPANITVILPPTSFSSVTARDQFFDRQIASVTAQAAVAVNKVGTNCDKSKQDCPSLVSAIEVERDAKIQGFETQRQSAVVD